MTSSNQAILLTAPGISAIAVIRIAGPDVRDFLHRHFSRPVRERQATYGRLTDAGRELDDPLVILADGGQRADICAHGGRWVVHSILELLQREGFTLAPNASDGPLPAIAVDGKDQIEREIRQYLPLARTRQAVQTLLAQRQAWTTPTSLPPEILADRSLFWLLHPPRIAVIGIPNAGKSTLTNALFGQNRSIVADLPGTTRDYVEDFANLSGLAVRLVDTPGLRQSGDAIEMAAIDIARRELDQVDLHVLLLDPTQDRALQDRVVADYPLALVVSGKKDLAPRWQGIELSAQTGQGIAELDLAIRERFGCGKIPHTRPCVWTDRQRELISRK